MSRRLGIALGLVLVAVAAAWGLGRQRRPPPRLLTAGPLQVSNRHATPLSVWGQRFPRGAKLQLTPGPTLEAVWEDEQHLGALLPPVALPPEQVRARLTLRVLDVDGRPLAGEAHVDVVNDAAFLDPVSLAVHGAHVAVASPNTDALLVDGAARAVGDGPRHVTVWRDGAQAWWVVTLEDEGALRLVSTASASVTRTVALGGRPQRALVDPVRPVAYVSDRARDEVLVVALDRGEITRRIAVDAKPDALALSDDGRALWVAALGAASVAAVDLTVATSTPSAVIIGPGAPIVGGPTAPYSSYVMGGTPARALVASPSLGVVFAATLGPNIGPNPDRMEVTMASGVTVIDARTRRFVRHVPLDRGVANDLAWDEATRRLVVADVGAGRVVVLDGARLAESDVAAARAQLAAWTPPLPEGGVRIREDAELAPAVPRRPTASMHLGPWAVALGEGGDVVVLERFARTVDTLRDGALVSRAPLARGPDPQITRRRGQIVYFTDVGHSRMSCDTCHPSGADGALLFTKGQPIQIHRSPSIRSAHDSAPFFTPARLASLAVMAHVVLTRNRYEDPPASPLEVAALAEYVRAMSAPPSPHRAGAGLPAALTLPDGRRGRPREGRALFEGKGGCAVAHCHPPPHFTADQDPATRGRFADVGTPRRLPLREAMQDAASAELPPPSLLGVWDNYPLLFSGAAGFAVEGQRVVPRDRFALARALELHAHTPLSPEELADVLAYLLTL